MTTKRFILRLGLVVLLSLTNSVWADSYSVRSGASDSVYFKSSAKLEFVEGVTTDLNGSIEIDLADPAKSTAQFRVDLRTLKTGIETRDKHMRERHLHTDKFPYAFFELKSITGFDPEGPKDFEQLCEGRGSFYIHGVKRSITTKLKVTRVVFKDSSAGFKIRAAFDLLLEDYQIPRPKLLFLKIARQIEVELVMEIIPFSAPQDFSLPDFEESER